MRFITCMHLGGARRASFIGRGAVAAVTKSPTQGGYIKLFQLTVFTLAMSGERETISEEPT